MTNLEQELIKALRFYADERNWVDTPSWDGDPGCFTPKAIPVIHQGDDGSPCDCGDTARAALRKLGILLDGEDSNDPISG